MATKETEKKKLIFTPNEAQLVNEMTTINNDLVALYKQQTQHEFATNEIKKIIHDMKAGKIKSINLIHGQTVVVPMNDMKDARKMLMDRKTLFDNALKGIEGQISHREDSFIESMMKVKRFLNEKLKDVKIPEPVI